MPDLTPTEARERLAAIVVETTVLPASFASDVRDAFLATTDALAVLVTWPALLAAGERAGKIEAVEEWESFCDHEAQIAGRRTTGRVTYRLTDRAVTSFVVLGIVGTGIVGVILLCLGIVLWSERGPRPRPVTEHHHVSIVDVPYDWAERT